MITYKSKSLTPELSDFQIENGCHTTQFISFESCIQLFREKYTSMELKDKPKGYRITNQGIEIVLD